MDYDWFCGRVWYKCTICTTDNVGVDEINGIDYISVEDDNETYALLSYHSEPASQVEPAAFNSIHSNAQDGHFREKKLI